MDVARVSALAGMSEDSTNNTETTRTIETEIHKETVTSYSTKYLSIYIEYPRHESTKGDAENGDTSRTEETTAA